MIDDCSLLWHFICAFQTGHKGTVFLCCLILMSDDDGGGSEEEDAKRKQPRAFSVSVVIG